ncbi:hypothetical protein DM02DRAFT_155968 [Periconia macrospinosa]|uniref:Uncharacterized protein n=1 Tax=Periconia macrospinosa TaxID=97972 RepID=A0A2V1ECZ7_9PLEO|nr:hypothetical protein DM02DRAFT_155968 [Periconia macrospinosa]
MIGHTIEVHQNHNDTGFTMFNASDNKGKKYRERLFPIPPFPLSLVCHQIHAEIKMEKYFACTKMVFAHIKRGRSFPAFNPRYYHAIEEVEFTEGTMMMYVARNGFSFYPPYRMGLVGLKKVYVREDGPRWPPRRLGSQREFMKTVRRLEGVAEVEFLDDW